MITAHAAGRVNLMGEHTDYNQGLVLPTLIPQRTTVGVTPRQDSRVRLRSEAFGSAEYALGAERPAGGWVDYVQGCTAILRSAGHELRGFDADIQSEVPVGAGVASSAALEVALLRALRAAFALALDDTELALVGQRAENEFVGARVGPMDQLAASLGLPGAALFLDTADLTYELVPLTRSAELLVIDSGVAHAHAGGGYNARREECEAACRRLGVASLRELEDRDGAALNGLPEPLGRRARHVLGENARVRASLAALRADDPATLGRLFDESHASQRDDFEVSTPEIERLAELLRGDESVHGARLTGGGFGGAVVALVRPGESFRVAASALPAYERATGVHGRTIVPA